MLDAMTHGSRILAVSVCTVGLRWFDLSDIFGEFYFVVRAAEAPVV